jgi:hypothetical protein
MAKKVTVKKSAVKKPAIKKLASTKLIKSCLKEYTIVTDNMNALYTFLRNTGKLTEEKFIESSDVIIKIKDIYLFWLNGLAGIFKDDIDLSAKFNDIDTTKIDNPKIWFDTYLRMTIYHTNRLKNSTKRLMELYLNTIHPKEADKFNELRPAIDSAINGYVTLLNHALTFDDITKPDQDVKKQSLDAILNKLGIIGKPINTTITKFDPNSSALAN